MSIRLGIDASQSSASCAISTNEGIIASATMEKPIENFPTLIRKVLSTSGISLNSIDEIVVCIGPGSQTGVRTAVVTGNALALALKKPVTGVLSTDATAILSDKKGPFIAAVSAGRRRWYTDDYCWDGDALIRLNNFNHVDDLPETAVSGFGNSLDSFINCAYGILKVAEEQRALINQLMVEEVRPFEFGGSYDM